LNFPIRPVGVGWEQLSTLECRCNQEGDWSQVRDLCLSGDDTLALGIHRSLTAAFPPGFEQAQLVGDALKQRQFTPPHRMVRLQRVVVLLIATMDIRSKKSIPAGVR
jgi:hypothetical protein